MKQRNPLTVFFLSLITLGIYAIVWQVQTKTELKKLGADIPTAWLIIVPLANLYWIWKYSQGVEKVSNGKISAVLTLILLLLLSIVGVAILQSEFNGLATQGTASTDSSQPPNSSPPTTSPDQTDTGSVPPIATPPVV